VGGNMSDELSVGFGSVVGSKQELSRVDAFVTFPARVLGLTQRSSKFSYTSFILVFGMLFFPAFLLSPELGGTVVVDLIANKVVGWDRVSGWVLHPLTPTISLSFGMFLIVGINCAWAANEAKRERIIQEIEPAGEGTDVLPDLRDETIVSGLVLIFLLPFWLYFLNQTTCQMFGAQSCLYQVTQIGDQGTSLVPWVGFTVETFARALVFFDFPEIYQWSTWGTVEVASGGGRHIVMVVRVMIDLLIISSIFQVVRINRSQRDAILSLDQSERRAKLTGRRIVVPLIHELRAATDEQDKPLKTRHKNAALALEAIGDPSAIHGLLDLLNHRYAEVRKRAALSIGQLARPAAANPAGDVRRGRALLKLKEALGREEKVTVQEALNKAIEMIEAA